MAVQVQNFPEFDPLDYDNLAKSCVFELMQQPAYPLPLPLKFRGSGVYAIFYTGTIGSFSGYALLASPASDHPIYVGKAVPGGSRKGSKTPIAAIETPLHFRIAEHAASIRKTSLQLGDFTCRFLVMKPVWITLAERFVITHHQPLWNVCIDGFGNHPPGKNRPQEVSWWDALHPGRPWAMKLLQTKTHGQALQKLASCLPTGSSMMGNIRQSVTASGDEIGFISDDLPEEQSSSHDIP